MFFNFTEFFFVSANIGSGNNTHNLCCVLGFRSLTLKFYLIVRIHAYYRLNNWPIFWHLALVTDKHTNIVAFTYKSPFKAYKPY